MVDTNRLINLTNSLLRLARTMETSNQIFFRPIRIDDIVFVARPTGILSTKSNFRPVWDERASPLPGQLIEIEVKAYKVH